MVPRVSVIWTLSWLIRVSPTVAGTGSVRALSPEELQELRKDIAVLDISEERQDELIRLVDSIVTSWIDQAFGLSAVQLSLSARANYAFAVGKNHGNLDKSHDIETKSLGNGAAMIPEIPTKKPRP